jgi:hypothetical protein
VILKEIRVFSWALGLLGSEKCYLPVLGKTALEQEIGGERQRGVPGISREQKKGS